MTEAEINIEALRDRIVALIGTLAHARKYMWAEQLDVAKLLNRLDKITEELAAAMPENRDESREDARMSNVLNPDGTRALLSAQPPGYPEAPAGYEYRSPDPACCDPGCSGSCWVIRKPESVSAEQFAHDMTAWKLARSTGSPASGRS